MMVDHKHRKQESGQAIILIAVATIALSAVLGMTIDGGGLFFLHRDSQNAVDAALVASLYAMCTGDRDDADYNQRIINAGVAAARVNGFEDGVNGTTVTVDPTYIPEGMTDEYYVRVSIMATKPSYFIQLVYQEPLTVFTSGAGYCQPTRNNLLPNAAVISLKNEPGCTGTNVSFRLNGNGTLRVENSGIWVNSKDPGCALSLNTGNSGKQALWVDGTCSVIGEISGDIQVDDPDSENENYCDDVWQPDAADREDEQIDTHPLRDIEPPSDACVGTTLNIDVRNGNTQTISPGRYNINVRNGGILRFLDGIYCIESMDYSGGEVTSVWDSDNDGDTDEHGVVLYMPYTNGMDATGQSSLRLTAPTTETCEAGNTCDWIGLLLWADVNPANESSLNDVLKLRGGNYTGWNGMIYAPRSLCDMAGGSGSVAVGQLVCWNVDYTGSGKMTIQHEQPQFLQIPPKVSISE